MRLDFVTRHGVRILVFSAVVIIVLGCSNGATTTTQLSGLSCTASGSAAGGTTGSTISVSGVSVYVTGGTGPFLITLPGASAVTSTSPSYTYSGSLNVSTDTSGNVSSYVSVSDQGTGSSTSCLLSVSGTGTSTGGGYYYGGSSGGAPYYGNYATCTLQFVAGYFYRYQQIPFTVVSSTGESVYLTSLSTGEPYAYQPTFPMLTPFYITYSQPGPKQIYLTAVTASGIQCNGGAGISDSVFINY